MGICSFCKLCFNNTQNEISDEYDFDSFSEHNPDIIDEFIHSSKLENDIDEQYNQENYIQL